MREPDVDIAGEPLPGGHRAVVPKRTCNGDGITFIQRQNAPSAPPVSGCLVYLNGDQLHHMGEDGVDTVVPVKDAAGELVSDAWIVRPERMAQFEAAELRVAEIEAKVIEAGNNFPGYVVPGCSYVITAPQQTVEGALEHMLGRATYAIEQAHAMREAYFEEMGLRSQAEAKLEALSPPGPIVQRLIEMKRRAEGAEAEVKRLTQWGLDMQRNANASAEKMRQMAESDSNRALRARVEQLEKLLPVTTGLCDALEKTLAEKDEAIGVARRAIDAMDNVFEQARLPGEFMQGYRNGVAACVSELRGLMRGIPT